MLLLLSSAFLSIFIESILSSELSFVFLEHALGEMSLGVKGACELL